MKNKLSLSNCAIVFIPLHWLLSLPIFPMLIIYIYILYGTKFLSIVLKKIKELLL